MAFRTGYEPLLACTQATFSEDSLLPPEESVNGENGVLYLTPFKSK